MTHVMDLINISTLVWVFSDSEDLIEIAQSYTYLLTFDFSASILYFLYSVLLWGFGWAE
jgi:hypothetical protein